MKKVLLIFLAMVAISLHVHAIFADEKLEKTDLSEYESEKQIIQELFQERAQLWNGLYEKQGKVTNYSGKLKDIVTEPLLSFDIESFQDAIAYPTDLEKVIDVNILHIDQVDYGRMDMKAEIVISWKMESLNSYYEEEVGYKVVLIKEDNKWKLSDYSVNQ